jgi:transposase-like protein
MASKGQKFRKHTNEFKLHVVHLRLVQKYSLRTVCRIYGLNVTVNLPGPAQSEL